MLAVALYFDKNMDLFDFRGSELYAEGVALAAIAERFGTPCYVYSRGTLERHWRAFDRAFARHRHLIAYSVKANSNLAVLDVLVRLGSGFDIVSVGELERVLAAGGDPSKIIFSGVGKREDEIRRALEVGIRCFNVESEPELERIERIARDAGRRAPIALRVNPDVDARSHPYISTGLKENKFGIDIAEALPVYCRAARSDHLEIIGIDCHIGSQMMDLAPLLDAVERIVGLADQLAAEGISIRHLDVGGGLGIRYKDESPPAPAAYAQALDHFLKGRDYEIVVEPGRAIAGNAGVLLTRVEYIKETRHRDFAIVDAAMNDLLRPALYSAHQTILNASQDAAGSSGCFDVVGPICETADFIGKGRALHLEPSDLVVVRSSGAYGFVMSSNYNTRPRAAEVMVDGDQAYLVRRRETIAELFAGESLLPE